MSEEKKESNIVPITPIKDLDLDQKKPFARRQYVEFRKTVKEISEEYDIKEPTLYKWIQKEGWTAERDRHEILLKQLAETLAFYEDPNTEVEAMAEANLKLMLKIQGIQLAQVQHAMMTGQSHLGITDMIQKYATALEKLNNTKIKLDNGGVDRSEVVHVHQVDMDQALKLALEARKRGENLSVGEAATALAEQMKKSKDAKSS